MQTRVWLMRHAETANPAVFHGAESDVGLSTHGLRQAEAAAEHFARLGPDAVVSSAMRRARDTALPIARACGLELEIEPALHERRVGALSGSPLVGAAGIWPETLRRWTAGETGYAPPGAESFDDIRARVLPAWERVVARHAGRSVLVVAHGVVCKVLLVSLLEGRSAADWESLGRAENMAVSELLGRGGAWRAGRILEVPEAVARLAKG
ncbi:MAG TPA: histidine phosphatase family protein [Gemmataceae bacterium]